MAVNAFGTVLAYHDGSSFVDVANVTSVSAPSMSRDSIETTHHTSTGGFRTYIPGLKDAGTVSLDINWEKSQASHSALYTQITTQVVNGQYRVVFPGSPTSTFTFYGHVTDFSVTAPVDDKLTASVTIKLSGKPTLA